MDNELLLADTVADPIEAHVNGFGATLLDCVVDDAGGASIVGLDWGRWLRMAHVVERGAEPCGILGVVKEGAHFGFSGRG